MLWVTTVSISHGRFTDKSPGRGMKTHGGSMSDNPTTPKLVPSPEFAIVRPHAAGLDIGAEEIFASSPPGEHAETVQRFGTFTADLKALVHWLKDRGVVTVAMESTGVYWIPVYDMLERSGIEVFLVNAHHVKSVTGRKTDLVDCQWIQKLHACGLLMRSFRPHELTVAVRSLFRHRSGLVAEAASSVQRMQKSLTQMNVQLHHAVADITGKTGLAIIDSILKGERSPEKLADLRDRRCKKDKATIAKALTGTWRDEHIFTIRQHLGVWRYYQQLIADTDAAIVAALADIPNDPNAQNTPPGPEKPNNGTIGFDAQSICHQKLGVDLTAIEGVGPSLAMAVLSEVGHDFSRFPNSASFCAWLGLAPNTKITGGKKLSSHVKKTKNHLTMSLRQSANALRRSKSALGAIMRDLERRLGTSRANVAMAHRLARYIYAMVTKGQAYVMESLDKLQERRKEKQKSLLQKLAGEFGYGLVPQ